MDFTVRDELRVLNFLNLREKSELEERGWNGRETDLQEVVGFEG